MANTLPKVFDKQTVALLMKQANLRYWTGRRNRAIMETLYRTGLRSGEIVNLRKEDVDLHGQWLHVKQGKGGADRDVPFDERLLGWLQLWNETRHPDSASWFHSRKGTQLDTSSLRHFMLRYARYAGMRTKGCSPHVLRHTYATELLEEGFNLRQVQELLGHSSVATTEVYTHIKPADLAEKIAERGEDKRAKVQRIAHLLLETDAGILTRIEDLLEAAQV